MTVDDRPTRLLPTKPQLEATIRAAQETIVWLAESGCARQAAVLAARIEALQGRLENGEYR